MVPRSDRSRRSCTAAWSTAPDGSWGRGGIRCGSGGAASSRGGGGRRGGGGAVEAFVGVLEDQLPGGADAVPDAPAGLRCGESVRFESPPQRREPLRDGC